MPKPAPRPSLLEFLEAVKEAENMKDLKEGVFKEKGGLNTALNYISFYRSGRPLVETKKVGRKTLVLLTEYGENKLKELKAQE